MLPGRVLFPLVVNSVAWACVLTWPWGGTLFPSMGVLALVHLAQPFWSLWTQRDIPVHRAFASGPLLIFGTDVLFLVAAWKQDSWGDLTAAFVPLLGAVALLALAYSAGVMTLIGRRR